DEDDEDMAIDEALELTRKNNVVVLLGELAIRRGNLTFVEWVTDIAVTAEMLGLPTASLSEPLKATYCAYTEDRLRELYVEDDVVGVLTDKRTIRFVDVGLVIKEALQ
ncbi:hypothetical protein, partial [Vibrio breoganii]|uniref:hypothetical protein n=1 Tax=Vibrio breoganii TaxID=553239 RepID=UPI0018E46F03